MNAAPRQEDWRALGQWLRARRVMVNPRWRNRTLFARETGISLKTLTDLELGHRLSFSPEMLALMEQTYRLRQGSLGVAIDAGTLPIPEESRDARVITRTVRGITVEIVELPELAARLSPEELETLRTRAAEAAAQSAEKYLRDHRATDG